MTLNNGLHNLEDVKVSEIVKWDVTHANGANGLIVYSINGQGYMPTLTANEIEEAAAITGIEPTFIKIQYRGTY